MKKYIFLLLSLVLMLVSCLKDEVTYLNIKTPQVIVSNIGGKETILFETNSSWDTNSSESWCIITPSRGGKSSRKISVTITANDNYENRSCEVSIMAGDVTKIVTVVQSQKDAIILSEKVHELLSDSYTLEVELMTNVEVEVIIPDDAKSWISTSETRTLTSEKVTLFIAENKDSDATRRAEVDIKNIATGLKEKLTIIQEGVTVATPEMSPKGGIYTAIQIVQIITDTEGAEIRYTLDGSEPIKTSKLYTDPIIVDEKVTLKAKAFKENWRSSLVASASYIITDSVSVIEGTANTIQHLDVSGNFIFKLNDLDQRDVFFVLSNENETSSIALPQLLQGDVENSSHTLARATESATYSTSSFVVSGKPSITKFNNNPPKPSGNLIEKTLHRQYSTSESSNLEVGSSEKLYDDLGKSYTSTVRKVISAHDKNLYVWVADNCWEEGGTKKYNVSQEMVDALAHKFLSPGDDNDIYEWVSNAIGEPWGTTPYSYFIPATNDIHIWLTDIDNDNTTKGTVTVGYFYSRDNYIKDYSDEILSNSNEKLMFTVDAVLLAETKNGSWSLSNFWAQEIISTLAHEFTHMIYFYQHYLLGNLTGDTAINEMCAQCVEDLVANKILADGPRGVPYATPSAGTHGNKLGRLPNYNSNNYFSLLDWDDSEGDVLINYSKTYALGAYLMRNYGGANFIKDLIQNNYTGIKSIVEAVKANGGDVNNYGDIMQQFGVANLLSDKIGMATGYKFNAEDWIKSFENNITYHLGAINLYNYWPVPLIYDELPATQKPGSNLLYRAGSNLSGEKEWFFKGMNDDIRVTVVIK